MTVHTGNLRPPTHFSGTDVRGIATHAAKTNTRLSIRQFPGTINDPEMVRFVIPPVTFW
jgi:hypothetical protein